MVGFCPTPLPMSKKESIILLYSFLNVRFLKANKKIPEIFYYKILKISGFLVYPILHIILIILYTFHIQ